NGVIPIPRLMLINWTAVLKVAKREGLTAVGWCLIPERLSPTRRMVAKTKPNVNTVQSLVRPPGGVGERKSKMPQQPSHSAKPSAQGRPAGPQRERTVRPNPTKRAVPRVSGTALRAIIKSKMLKTADGRSSLICHHHIKLAPYPRWRRARGKKVSEMRVWPCRFFATRIIANARAPKIQTFMGPPTRKS